MKFIRKFSAIFGFLLILLSWACQNTSTSSIQGTVIPTTAAQIRKIPTKVDHTQITPLSEADNSGQFTVYYHPSGVFQSQYPTGWQVDTSDYGAVFISEPDGEGTISVTATYTGYALSGEDFVNFINAREENFFAAFNDYQPAITDFNELTDEVFVSKMLTYQDIPETVDSYYFHQNETIITVDVWMESSKENDYQEIYRTVRESFTIDSTNVSDFPLYNFVITYFGPVDLFSFEVPVSWQYHYKSLEGVIADRFSTPDGQAFIEHLTIYGVEEIPQKEQEQKLVDMFQKIWDEPQDNLRVKSRERFDDGSNYILWKSDSNEWQFETVYRVYEGKILALSGLIRPGFEDIYQSSIDYAFDWYQVPFSEE